jgi:hypothetical protein
MIYGYSVIFFSYFLPMLAMLSMGIAAGAADSRLIVCLVPVFNWIISLIMLFKGGSEGSTLSKWLMFWSVVWAVIYIVYKTLEAERARLEEANRMRQREERQREEEERQRIQNTIADERRRVQNAIARAQALAAISQLVSGAQLSAAKLSLLMAEAESALDLAEREFSDGLYSPFWEAMESAAQSMHSFDKTLEAITSAQQRYAVEAPPLRPDAVSFSLGITVLPSPSSTSGRMKELYRKAQKDSHFAQIYEQRRTIYEQRRTNEILIEGFRSLGDDLTYLGDRIESKLQSVGSRMELRLADIDSALRDSSKQMEGQQQALLQEAKSWREEARSGNAELAVIARRNAEQAENSARERRAMLDNIQHHRKPSLLTGH